MTIVILVNSDLPDVASLRHVTYQEPMRIYTQEGDLIAEYGYKNRRPITYDHIPQSLIHAIVATEDRRFYEHPGVDLKGIVRAAIDVIKKGEKTQGASTITMQVARNFFLHRKKSWLRKIKEIVLAIQIEQYYSKEDILLLYFNKIYFGNHAYGIQAASYNYYGKDIQELELHEIAMLAGLPKAPSSSNPLINPTKALARRHTVLKNMWEEGFISEQDYLHHSSQPNTAERHYTQIQTPAPYAADLIRQYLVSVMGSKAYTMGLHITTTLQSQGQIAANAAIKEHLTKLDLITGPGAHPNQSPQHYARIKPMPELETTYILHGDDTGVYVQDSQVGPHIIPWNTFLSTVHPTHHKTIKKWPFPLWQYTQFDKLIHISKNNAALVTMHATSGAVTAMVGGKSFGDSAFNRATSAYRQIGSIVKPLVLASALENGLTLADQINDSPIVLGDQTQAIQWRPNNVDHQFRGFTTMREGVVKSRNLVVIRLLSHVSVPKFVDKLTAFGFDKLKQHPSESLALGSGLATPAQTMAAYSAFLNKGYLQRPYMIAAIKDPHQKSVTIPQGLLAPGIYATADQHATKVLDAQHAYLVYDVLKDVANRGTARRTSALGRDDVVGKTGTTNQHRDAWFVGAAGPFVTSVWVGHDESLPIKLYGSQIAIPLWLSYMKPWHKHIVSWYPERPDGLITRKVKTKDSVYFEHFTSTQSVS